MNIEQRQKIGKAVKQTQRLRDIGKLWRRAGDIEDMLGQEYSALNELNPHLDRDLDAVIRDAILAAHTAIERVQHALFCEMLCEATPDKS